MCHRSSGNTPDSRGGSCCGRTRFRTTTVILHPRDWFPTWLIVSFLATNSVRKTLPRRNTSPRWFPSEISQHAICLIEDVALLLDRHVHWVLMTIPVQPDLVARIAHSCHIFRERLQTVPWDEPSCFDIVLSSIRWCLL